MKHGIIEDAVALAGQEPQKHKDKNLHSAEWAEKDDLLFFQGYIYVPDHKDIQCHIITS